MADFFEQVTSIKEDLSELRQDLDKLEKLKSRVINAPEAGQLKEQVAKLIESMDKRSKKVAQQLQKIAKDNKEFEGEKSRIGTSEDRIRQNMLSTLTRRFTELMGEYQDKQADYRESCRDALVRQYKITNPMATADDLEQIRNGDEDAEVFKAKMLQRDQYIVARNRLADIQDRHMDIVKLSQSIRELHQLFMDMALLVESQGELIHQIEYNVVSAVEYTAKAEQELIKAVKLQSSARKKACCIVIILLIVLVVILAPVLITQLGRA